MYDVAFHSAISLGSYSPMFDVRNYVIDVIFITAVVKIKIMYDFFLNIVAALTKWKTTEQIYVPSTTSIPFKETTVYTTIASLTNTSYILFGVVVAILLFIIVIQLCKRSKSASRSTSDRGTYDASNELQEMHVRNIKPSNTGKFNQPIEAEYYEIDEQFEMKHSPAVLSTSPRKYERPCLPQTPENLRIPLTPRDNYQCHPLNKMYADNFSEASDKNNSDLYLQPIFVQENIHTDN